MKSIANTIVTITLALVMTLLFTNSGNTAGPPSAPIADVNVVNEPNVSVVNEPNVNVANEPTVKARQDGNWTVSFQPPVVEPVYLSVQLTNSGILNSNVYTVPSDKILIIENVSFNFDLLSATLFDLGNIIVGTDAGGPTETQNYMNIPPAVYNVRTGTNVITGGQTTRLYALPNTTVWVQGDGPTNLSWAGRVDIMGQLVPAE